MSAPSKSGIDTLLTQKGKALKPGQQLRLTLVKGPSGIVVADPVSAKAPPETFPLVAKFPESVVKPDMKRRLRLYQQDVPKAQDDSDDEEAANANAATTRKRRRWRRRDVTKRQWIMQPETDFLEDIMRSKQQKMQTKESSEAEAQATNNSEANKYVGLSEHNPSQYVLFQVTAQKDPDAMDDSTDDQSTNHNSAVQVRLLPAPHAVQAFSLPLPAAMSLTQAEHAIQDQRAHMSRYMMHHGNKLTAQGSNANSKSRLFAKLSAKGKGGEGESDDDDVMGDVTFSNRKGGGRGARKELLSSMEDGIKVDNDGVLGGTNDAEFGGRRHFGRYAAEKDTKEDLAKAAGTEKAAVSNDGLAMADDFYQRDVKAEYEDLDYDANEQFDDDDVDLGESEVVVDPNSGFGEEQDDQEDNEDEEELTDLNATGAEGLASVSGFRALLAKARGVSPDQEGEGDDAAAGKKDDKEGGGSRAASPKAGSPDGKGGEAQRKKSPTDSLAQVLTAAEKAAVAASQKKAPSAKTTGVELDEKGERYVTLEGIRREIWLHHGAITTKRLMKIFNIKKKTSAERRDKFLDLVKELCIMKDDPVEGKVLVLKQHYSNM